MKVFNLCCERDHRFEGWFGSAADYDEQLSRGLLECPLCGSREVRKLLSAPRLNLSNAAPPEARGRDKTVLPEPPGPGATPEQFQRYALELARSLLENTEDVGDRFAEEARRIHYREAEERSIRGTASVEEAQALAEEGIEVYALPLGPLTKEPLQ